MEKLKMKLGNYEGILSRPPKNMEETARILYNTLETYNKSLKEGKNEITISIINEKIYKNGRK